MGKGAIPHCTTRNREKTELVREGLVLLVVVSIAHLQTTQNEIALCVWSKETWFCVNSLMSKPLKEMLVTHNVSA